jgi:hypothetical protein
MKVNNIENFIKENLDQFDSDYLEKGHIDRFLDKLERSEKTLNLRRKYLYYAVAASLILLFSFSGYLLWNYTSFKNKTKNIDLTISNIEFKEAGEYFNDQINIRLDQIKSMKCIDPELKDSVFKEFEAMDTNFRQLQDELSNNPNDERIMRAIIGHYQIKLNAVDQIIQSFSISTTNFKNIRHENSI